MAELGNFILHAGLVAKIVLLILFILSLISWTIIFEKLRLLTKVKKESNQFLHLFRLQTSWNDLYKKTQDFRYSPFARIFRRNFNNLRVAYERHSHRRASYSGENPLSKEQPLPLKSALEIVIAEEVPALEKRLIFLATTVSVSPFLGLLGTVWGIMTAFLSMGVEGSADITAVGPGIAEALITTVAGLAVAIPAVVAYNYFVDKFHRLETELDNFARELIIITEEEHLA